MHEHQQFHLKEMENLKEKNSEEIKSLEQENSNFD